MNRLIEPDDIAGAAVWLAGDDSRQVTGTTVTVDGGFAAR
jgi:NAD(P)-dependent dehydrogenase (short-subunit alcohol dehydrogenase family)